MRLQTSEMLIDVLHRKEGMYADEHGPLSSTLHTCNVAVQPVLLSGGVPHERSFGQTEAGREHLLGVQPFNASLHVVPQRVAPSESVLF